MFYNLSFSALLFIVVGSVAIYLLIVAAVYGKKFFSNWTKLFGGPVVQTAGAQARAATAWPAKETMPPLIDKPADHPVEQAKVYEQDEEEISFDIVEDEGGTTLLKEAEKVVEEIQEVVNNIESRPANPEEVYTKIRSIVTQYRMFINTEYFDAINSFIATTVERDCDLVLAADDLATLWYAQAA